MLHLMNNFWVFYLLFSYITIFVALIANPFVDKSWNIVIFIFSPIILPILIGVKLGD